MGWRRHLGDDETVIADLRAHPKALVVPVVFLFALAAACGVALAMVPAAVEPWAGWLIAVITAALAIAFVQRPVLAWATTRYGFTDRRLVVRAGLLRRRRSDLPYSRITDVSYARGLLDRLWGSGTLVVTTASGARLELIGMPQVIALHQAVSQLVAESRPAAPDMPY